MYTSSVHHAIDLYLARVALEENRCLEYFQKPKLQCFAMSTITLHYEIWYTIMEEVESVFLTFM